MVYHNWSDDTFDWKGLDAAGYYIADNLVKWGRINVRDHKEKFGCLRMYLSYGWDQVHSIIYPQYHYNQFPQWLWNLDCSYLRYLVQPLNIVVVPYHKFLYRLFYKRAIKKWPHLKQEILSDADQDLVGDLK